jgi:hypothetical protein
MGGAAGTASGSGGASGGPAGGAGGVAGMGGAAGSTSGGGTAGAGGGTGGVGAVCSSNDGCRAALYCKKLGCGPVDLLGRCATRPTNCAFEDNPICGCDGFTYLNACIAELNGQNVATQPGMCGDGVAIKCVPGDKTCDARPNGVCGVIVADHNSCAATTISGKCWVIPDECVATGTHYDSCNGNGKCIHTCDVVKDEIPYYPAPELCNL